MFAFFGPGPIELMVVGLTLMLAVLPVLPFWLIFEKAGFSGAWSLLALLPGVDLIMLFFLAFADWPALQHVRHADREPPNPQIPKSPSP
jgi:hypothetical protein